MADITQHHGKLLELLERKDPRAERSDRREDPSSERTSLTTTGTLPHLLRKLLEHAGHQQHVAVLDGADVDEHQIGVGGHCGVLDVARVRLTGGLELKQHLLLGDLGEVELAVVKRLHHLVRAELRGALLCRPPLVELRNELEATGHHLYVARHRRSPAQTQERSKVV